MKPLYVALILVAAILMGGVYTVVQRELSRPGSEVVERAEKSRKDAELRLMSAETLPLLPPLEPTFFAARSLFENCGLNFQAVADSALNGEFYESDSPAWHAVVTGIPLSSLSCAYFVIQELPVVVNSLAIQSGKAEMKVSVLGRITDRVQ